jgi:hypothetical protein
MFLYTIMEALAGIVAGIWLAFHTKKSDGVTYGKLDRAGRVTNIILIPVYFCLSPLYMFLGMICSPANDGFWGLLGWIISIVCASCALVCGVGLGLSVAFRKRGKSRLGFAIQFAGLLAIGLTILLYTVFVGNLLRPLN